MNTAAVEPRTKARTAYQEVLRFKEEFEMRLAMRISQVNVRIHQVLATKTPVKLLGGLALGALVMAATALPFGGLTYADEPARPLSIEEMGDLPAFLQTEVWLPGDTYPMAAYSGKVAKAESEDLPAFLQTEIWLPGDTYPVAAYSSKGAKADSEDLPAFLQTEVWLPGDAYPVSVGSGQAARVQGEDLPAFMQTEVWLPGDTYPAQASNLPDFMQTEVWLPGDTYPVFGR